MVTTLAGDPNASGDYGDYDDFDDGFGTAAEFDIPQGLAISGTKLYVADSGNQAIRLVDTETKEVTTFAGEKDSRGIAEGTGTNAKFSNPAGLAISGTNLYVADYFNYAIRLVNTETALVTTLVGEKGTSGTAEGFGTNAQFNYPWGLAISGNQPVCGRFS